MADFDLAIIGGGINGVGLARDAAGRGLRVLLVEQNDLGSGTSSASSKLIHGGLRYLEHGALRLVHEALAEREVLLRMAPHIVRPLRIVLPVAPGGRSAWLMRLGLFVYDHLGGRRILPPTRSLDLTHHSFGHPLNRRFRIGFEFSDCQVDDSRLVIFNAIDAAARGAQIRPRTRCVRAERSDVWRLILNDHGRRDVVSARLLINAAGPWAGFVNDNVIRLPAPGRLRLVKGSHIVVRRLFEHDRGYLLQSPDGRVVFALPFARDFTLIGTTDEDFNGDPAAVAPTGEEITYLMQVVNGYFRQAIDVGDVKWAFAGVRSLYNDGAKKPEDATRDYHLVLDERFREAPLLTIYGGKITTYRRLAEAALKRISHFFPYLPPWTARAPLPGGDFRYDALEAQVAHARESWPFLDERHARRLVQTYGTRIDRVLAGAKTAADLGERFGADLTEAELHYLKQQEWAETAEDVLWRRTKLGLTLTEVERQAVGRFMAAPPARPV
ncbi:glycerol-3-phosphate dehydrogenase [Bradyrhizobium sp.]|uniref:glycerol-3-phosphate dehydrogenase n=1 Tax=Bradyrhizobium sp. TaxID=376 RepID=UPI002D7109FF|nr:glycerol-3-phosphate dehydrogenase [Bradyrhizobium sp.]HZR77024.1 glycerol-3-phosphate dehydrogenase [Bradyrhizobium sp.]